MKKVGPFGEFCLDDANLFVGGNDWWDVKLCQAMETLFKQTSIIDFGAGLGHYGRCFLRDKDLHLQTSNEEQMRNLKDGFIERMKDLISVPKVVHSWHGYDGGVNVERLTGGFIREIDLSERDLNLGRKWDWVISLEVGEHIPKENEEYFIDNLVRHGCQGIVLTWATPGQGGYSHINERTHEYIISKIEAKGLRHIQEASTMLRDAAEVYWLKNNVLVFRYNNPQDCK